MKKIINSIVILAILMVFASCQKKSTEKQIISFVFVSPDVEATIDNDNMNITATVPYGTDVTRLTPVITVSEGATVNPASGMPMDFTRPVIYTVTAEDGSQASYAVTVSIDTPERLILGVWGVEKIEYYNSDYDGNPIESTMTTESYDPYDANYGIQFVFREDNTCELRDGSIDTLWLDYDDETGQYGTVIVCPDTILVKSFTYSFDLLNYTLLLTGENENTYRLQIKELDDEFFVYENVYFSNYVEKAYMRRISFVPDKSNSLNRPIQQGTDKADGPLLKRK